MNKRKTPPLTLWGEYISTDADNEQLYRARLLLIETTRVRLPDFLKKLSAEVFPFYEVLTKEGFDFKNTLWREQSPYASLPDGSLLKDALLKWAKEFHAEEQWLLDAALRNFWFWHSGPELHQALAWKAGRAYSANVPFPVPPQFDFPAWDVTLETWKSYSAKIHLHFDKVLGLYEKEVRRRASSAGLVRVQSKYSPENFEWFILYQFGGQSSTEIVNSSSSDLDESTVLKGVQAVKNLIGWSQLRPRQNSRNRKIR